MKTTAQTSTYGLLSRCVTSSISGCFRLRIDRQAVIHDMYQNTCHKTPCLIIKPGKQETDEASTYYLNRIQMKDTKYQPGKQDSLCRAISAKQLLGNGTTEKQFFQYGPKQKYREYPANRIAVYQMSGPTNWQKSKFGHQKTYYTYGSHSGKQAPCQIRD